MSNNPEMRGRTTIASCVGSKAEGSIEFASVRIASSNDVVNGVAKADLGPADGIIGITKADPIPEKKGWLKFLERVDGFLEDKDKVKWMENMRGSLSMAISIIAAITFQVATNPPGGVVQVSPADATNPPGGVVQISPADDFNAIKNCIPNGRLCTGYAVLAIAKEDDYLPFFVCNTLSFIASLSVCLLLVSGLPLKHRPVIWILCIGMCITISSLALTYLFAASLVTPDSITNNVFSKVLITWAGLLAVVAFVLVLRLLVWVENKCINDNYKKLAKHLRTWSTSK